jgi:hypothetical protein
MEAYRQAQLAEYSKYVATQDIYAGLALAYRKGDPVPTSNVEAQGYDKNGLAELVNPPPKASPTAAVKKEGDK